MNRFEEWVSATEGRTLAAVVVVWVLTIGAAVLVGTLGAALGHEAPSGWEYDPACCSTSDCAPVPDTAVVEVRGGYAVLIRAGEHPMVRAIVGDFLAHGDPRLRPSGDARRHACVTSSGRVLCVYVRPGEV